MALVQIVTHTPAWVWVLLAYLVYAGIRALRPRLVSPARMLILPLVFLLWAGIGITTEIQDWPRAALAFLPGLLLGGGLTWWIAGGQPAARRDPESGGIWRPGSPLTLVLALCAFVLKYALSATLATHPALAASAGFAGLFGAISGLVDGAFWGQTLRQFARAYRPAPARA